MTTPQDMERASAALTLLYDSGIKLSLRFPHIAREDRPKGLVFVGLVNTVESENPIKYCDILPRSVGQIIEPSYCSSWVKDPKTSSLGSLYRDSLDQQLDCGFWQVALNTGSGMEELFFIHEQLDQEARNRKRRKPLPILIDLDEFNSRYLSGE